MKQFFKKLLSSIGFIFVITFLGSLGGQGIKEVRRFILPLIVTIYAYFLLQNIWVLTIYLMAFPLSIGYGIPDATDEGSAIGRFFYKMFHNSALWANVFTRGFVGLLISLSMLSVPIITNSLYSFLLGSLIIILIWALNSWRGYGEIQVQFFGNKINLLNVDLITYGITSIGFIIIINRIVG
jgi:hypothetical protein